MRRPPQPRSTEARHAQGRPVISTGRQEAIVGLVCGSVIAAGFLIGWLAAGAPL